MSAALLLFLQLTLPGFALASLLRVPGPRYLHSVGLSFTLFVLLYTGARYGHWPVSVFNLVYFGIIALALLAAAYRSFQTTPDFATRIRNRLAIQRPAVGAAAAAMTGLLLAYLLVAGPYLEIPSDAFAHLKYMQQTSRDWLMADSTGLTTPGRLMNSHVWYDFVSYSLSLSHSTVADASRWLHIVIIPLFLLGVFRFAAFLYENNTHNPRRIAAFAILSGLFVALHLGVSIFSFIRYYALAPTMINLVLYFAAMSLVLDAFRHQELSPGHVVTALAYFVAMLIVHTQEALFMAIMTGLLALYYSFAKSSNHTVSKRARRSGNAFSLSLGSRSAIVFTAMILLVAVSGWYYAHHFMTIRSAFLPRVMEIASLGGEKYFVLNPARNFYQALTHWGLAVYVLFLIYIRSFLKQPYLLMGMVSPLITVFNPLFIDLFLRFYSDNTLWRFAYLAPIHFAAAHIVMTAWAKAHQKNRLGKILSYAVIGIILLALLPISANRHTLFFDRYPTMGKVPDRNSPAYLSDLLHFLGELPGHENILTDPTTAYVISALTPHHAPGNKFFPLSDYKLRNKRYLPDAFADEKNWLIVINRRAGEFSETGNLSRHWYADVLDKKKYYSSAFLETVTQHPEQFRELWKNGDIAVYRIQ